jgi:hypothetical protein
MPWGGHLSRKARAHVAQQLPAPCWRCGTMLTEDGPWTVGHLVDRAIAPHLADDPDNWAPECARCNYRAGAAAGNRKRARTPRRVTSRDW